MAHVVIVGGGFAGVWSAAGAAPARGDADLRITLIAPGEHRVLRPRLYEPDPDLATVELRRIPEPIGVEHLIGSVDTIDTERRVVSVDGREIDYDRLVLAAGSKLGQPRGLPGAERLFDIDTLGVQLGPGPREIEKALHALGIERRLGTTLAEVGDGYAVLADGTRVQADAVVWSVGMRASELTRQITEELDHLDRVPVDGQLRALPEVFVAGDAAAAVDAEHTVLQACQHASPLGKVAGFNAVADLLGNPLRDFTPGPYVICLDLGGAGGVFTRGWGRRVMATGPEGADVKKRINQAIHPPVDDAAAILAAADRVRVELPFFPGFDEEGSPAA